MRFIERIEVSSHVSLFCASHLKQGKCFYWIDGPRSCSCSQAPHISNSSLPSTFAFCCRLPQWAGSRGPAKRFFPHAIYLPLRTLVNPWVPLPSIGRSDGGGRDENPNTESVLVPHSLCFPQVRFLSAKVDVAWMVVWWK